MKAIMFDRPGSTECLVLRETEVPRPGPNEVLIRVRAAGINRADVYQRQGEYAPPAGASTILGLEVAGEIAELGSHVTGFRAGERVMALLNGGGYAEYALAPVETLLPIPENLSFVQAAAIPEAYFTVWSCVFELGRLQTGETFLIHGGASGIGSVAIPLARHFGARVFATARNEERRLACVQLGAHEAINSSAENFLESVKTLTDGAGVDVILDMAGGDYLPRNISLLKRGGRLVHIDCAQGDFGTLDIGRVITRNLTVTGAVLRPRPLSEKARLRDDISNRLVPLLRDGKIVPVVGAVFSLADAGRAHSCLEAGECAGKVVFEVG